MTSIVLPLHFALNPRPDQAKVQRLTTPRRTVTILLKSLIKSLALYLMMEIIEITVCVPFMVKPHAVIAKKHVTLFLIW